MRGILVSISITVALRDNRFWVSVPEVDFPTVRLVRRFRVDTKSAIIDWNTSIKKGSKRIKFSRSRKSLRDWKVFPTIDFNWIDF